MAVSSPGTFAVAVLGGYTVGAFTGGMVRFPTGADSAALLPILAHTRSGTLDVIALWTPPAAALAIGNPVILTVGCDKRFETCRGRFNNINNFRGFPHIPGNDFLTAYARQGEPGLDGGLLTS